MKEREITFTDSQVYVLARSPLYRLWRALCSLSGRRTRDLPFSLREGCFVLVMLARVQYASVL